MSGACIVFSGLVARAGIIHDGLPWTPAAGAPPQPFVPGPWRFFTSAEGRAMEAVVDRIIPPDPETPGGKDAGVAVYIDRQLAGPFGRDDGQYRSGPFHKGAKSQGAQSPLTPAEVYRKVIAALDAHCAATYDGRAFADLDDDDKDKTIAALEAGQISIEGVESTSFFTMLLKNTREGFFADPIYGGNRDMVGWKMIGFPGARYDLSDWIDRHNERYPHPPISLTGAPSWDVR